jgi:hypothetical protein
LIELVLKPMRDATGNVTTLDVTVRLADTVLPSVRRPHSADRVQPRASPTVFTICE